LKVARQTHSSVSASVLAQAVSWLRYQYENAARSVDSIL
jgi:hypothetical protein